MAGLLLPLVKTKPFCHRSKRSRSALSGSGRRAAQAAGVEHDSQRARGPGVGAKRGARASQPAWAGARVENDRGSGVGGADGTSHARWTVRTRSCAVRTFWLGLGRRASSFVESSGNDDGEAQQDRCGQVAGSGRGWRTTACSRTKLRGRRGGVRTTTVGVERRLSVSVEQEGAGRRLSEHRATPRSLRRSLQRPPRRVGRRGASAGCRTGEGTLTASGEKVSSDEWRRIGGSAEARHAGRALPA